MLDFTGTQAVLAWIRDQVNSQILNRQCGCLHSNKHKAMSLVYRPSAAKEIIQFFNSIPTFSLLRKYKCLDTAIAGKMGQKTDRGFVLDEPNIQTLKEKAETA